MSVALAHPTCLAVEDGHVVAVRLVVVVVGVCGVVVVVVGADGVKVDLADVNSAAPSLVNDLGSDVSDFYCTLRLFSVLPVLTAARVRKSRVVTFVAARSWH